MIYKYINIYLLLKIRPEDLVVGYFLPFGKKTSIKLKFFLFGILVSVQPNIYTLKFFPSLLKFYFNSLIVFFVLYILIGFVFQT